MLCGGSVRFRPLPAIQNPICICQDAKRHLLFPLIARKGGQIQFANYKQPGAFLDVRDALGQLAKAADGEVGRLAPFVFDRQAKVGVLIAALLGCFYFAVVRGVSDKVD